MPEHSGEAITTYKIDPWSDAGVTVSSAAQEVSGKLADRHTAYHENISPPLNWTAVPDVASWAVVVEDPDAPRDQPFVHWMIWDIPADALGLPEGIANASHPVTPQNATQGRNDNGSYGWTGPMPPAGHGVHRYYFQVFALGSVLDMDADTTLPDLLNALKGSTIAKGEMMATYEAPTAQ